MAGKVYSRFTESGIMDNLANGTNANESLEKVKPPLSLDLILAQCLNKIVLLYKTALLPGEVRIWKESFDGEREEMLEWAFGEYFKTGTFPPKPADIAALIRAKREAMPVEDYRGPSDDELARLRTDRESFFGSDEYKSFVDAFDRKNGLAMCTPERRAELKAQAESLRK